MAKSVRRLASRFKTMNEETVGSNPAERKFFVIPYYKSLKTLLLFLRQLTYADTQLNLVVKGFRDEKDQGVARMWRAARMWQVYVTRSVQSSCRGDLLMGSRRKESELLGQTLHTRYSLWRGSPWRFLAV